MEEAREAIELGLGCAFVAIFWMAAMVACWDIVWVLDRATNNIIKFMYNPITWLMHKLAQVMVLLVIALAITLAFNPELRSEVYWMVRYM